MYRAKKSQAHLASLCLSTTPPSPEEKKWGSDLVRSGVNKTARARNRFEKDSISVGGGRGLLCHPSGGGQCYPRGVALSQEVTLYMEIPPPPPSKQNQTRPKRAIIDLCCKCTTFTYRWFSSLMFSIFAARF